MVPPVLLLLLLLFPWASGCDCDCDCAACWFAADMVSPPVAVVVVVWAL